MYCLTSVQCQPQKLPDQLAIDPECYTHSFHTHGFACTGILESVASADHQTIQRTELTSPVETKQG